MRRSSRTGAVFVGLLGSFVAALVAVVVGVSRTEAGPRRDVGSMVGEQVVLDGGLVWVDRSFGPGPVVLREAIAWVETDPYGKIARGEAALTLSGMPPGCSVAGSPEAEAGAAGRWRYVFRCPPVDGSSP